MRYIPAVVRSMISLPYCYAVIIDIKEQFVNMFLPITKKAPHEAEFCKIKKY